MIVLLELHSRGLALEFDAEIGRGPKAGIDLLPGRDAILAGRQTGEVKLAVRVGYPGTGEVVSVFGRNAGSPQCHHNSTQGLPVGVRRRIVYNAADAGGVGRQEDVDLAAAA